MLDEFQWLVILGLRLSGGFCHEGWCQIELGMVWSALEVLLKICFYIYSLNGP